MKIEDNYGKYNINEKLFENKKSIVYSATKENESDTYIIKVLNIEYPNEEEINDFLYQSEIIKNVNIEGISEAIEFIDINNTKALVFKNEGAIALNRIENGLLTLQQKLEIFLRVLEILEELHKNKIIHKDINPSNIIYNSINNYVELIDFESATKLSEEKIIFDKTILEGTLDYISPEQTGRLNRRVDYRSDLYSLGATFYEVFSGKKLFENNKDLLELIYFQVAKEPKELSEIDSTIPKVISNIIKKMLAKNVEDRYQSASGVKEDISSCLKFIEKNKEIPDFEVGKKDRMSQFFISEKLYGRIDAFSDLNKAYGKASLEGFEIVILSGDKGSGKTALASDLQNLILKNKGIYNYGKFNKSQMNYPYSAFKLFSYLVKNLLSEPNDIIEVKKVKILKAVGNRGKLLFDFIPELKFLLGDQPEVEILPPTETKNRLLFTFIEFLKVFMNENNPLIIFLDDCQFVNEASLEIFKAIGTQIDLRNLMMVYSYDKKEENENLNNLFEYLLENSKANISKIELKNLDVINIENLLKDSTSNKIENLEEFANLIFDVTKGLPYLVKEYIKTLYNKKFLSFDNKELIWKWNKEESQKINYLNQEDIVKELINSCNENELNLLKTLSVFGENFNFNLVNSIFYDNKRGLEPLLNSLMYKGLIEATNEKSHKNLNNVHFKFKSKDLFNLIDESLEFEKKQLLHIQIGTALMDIMQKSEDDGLIFETTSHVNWALKTDAYKNFISKIANLNYKAGIKARNSSAFKAAFNYYEIALHLYEEDKEVPEILYLGLCETAYSTSEYEKMELYFSKADSAVKNEELKLRLVEIKICAHLSKGEPQKALDFALKILKTFDINFPKEAKQSDIVKNILKIKMLMIGKNIEKLSEMPLMKDQKQLGIMRILGATSVSAFLISQEHFMLIAIKQLELSIKYGNSPQSSFAYTTYGVILCGALGDLKNGYKIGVEALKLLKKFNTTEYAGRTTVCAYLFNLHWQIPLNNVHKELDKAYDLSLKSGDLEFASWALLCRDFHGFFAGKNLKNLRDDLEYSTNRIKYELKQEKQYYTSNSFLSLVEYLLGSENKECFAIEKKLQERFEQENYKNGLYYVYCNPMIKNLIMGHYEDAYAFSKKADLYVESVISTVNYPEFYFYSSLSCLLGNANPSNEELKLLTKKLKDLKKWAKFGPLNHKYKYELIKNLYNLYIDKKDVDFETYDSIIKVALKNGFIGDGALITEIVSIIAKNKGNDGLAKFYLTSSFELYTRWGAHRKIKKMSEEFSVYPEEQRVTITGSIKNSVDGILDSTSLIKISELLIAESKYEKVISKMTEIVMENAGAERGFYISKKNNDLFVEVEFDINNNKLKELSKPYLEYENAFSKSLINYSCRTGEIFVFINAYDKKENFSDDYVSNNRIKSLLVLPVIVQNKIVGAFYLENNLIAGVFTKQRVEFLKVIALQGAIAIENIRMYHTLEEKVKERTLALKKANELLEEQKLEAEKARFVADEATRIKSEFLANMSHEIRTPMNGVMGLTYLLKKTDLDERQLDYLNKIDDSAKHLLNVINDILDFSKVEAGKLELEKRNFKLENIFSNISNVFVKTIEDKGLELIEYIDPEIPTNLIGDEVRLKQTLINLIGNAVKFTEEGEIVVKVEMIKRTETHVSILFGVRDTGIGLSSEQKNKLFKSFTQADGSITRKYGGTGLGLAISKSFVELMGGHIGVTSKLNKGSDFYFELEFEIGEVVPKNDIFNLKGLKTLIVDDSKTSVEILKNYMENYGCLVEYCYSGEEALERIKATQEDPYKLLLIDWKMPKMDGIQTIEKIKDSEGIADIPLVIMVSAFNIDEIKKEGQKLNVNGYLTKPIQQSSLLDTIINSIGVTKETINETIEETKFSPLIGKVLLVEDNIVNQLVAKELLEYFGLIVDIVDNGLDAVANASNINYDLVFMDIQMPGIDGYETTKKIKEMGIKVPIIAMTANVLNSDVEKCYEAGMEDYIAKPISPEKLHFIISKWLKNIVVLSDEGKRTELPLYSGINIRNGLRRAMGKLDVFNKVLKIFINEFINAQEQIDLLIQKEDKKSLLQYIHTLKGAAGNISAEELYENTCILENKIHDWTFNEKDLNIFFNNLDLVLENKNIFEGKENKNKSKNKVEIVGLEVLNSLKDELFDLREALKIGSFNSESIFEKIQEDLGNHKVLELVGINEAIVNFEYEKASQLLESLLRKQALI